MYLKSLNIHGFKSFADKTHLEFAQGVTGIVGPNGCGKSNVVDAIRWVLGETSAKALRGGEMADVIFNGAEKRKPLGMAEVTLTLADCEVALKTEHNEVSVTRRVYRDGKSEYLINGTRCRLRDIGDLFMDTGIGRSSYSIMEQGKIDMLLSAKPEDRRQVFEEAAGITKSKKEKKEALRKLEYTEGNLLRVSDVLAEQERRINSLKRQVSKARRYQALSKDVTILDTHLSYREFTQLSGERQELTVSLTSLERERGSIESDMPEHEKAVVDARDLAQALDAKLSGLRQRLSDKKNAIQAAENRIAFNNERKGELSERLSQNEKEITDTADRLSEQKESLDKAQLALVDLEKRILEQESRFKESQQGASQFVQQRQILEAQLRKTRAEANATQSIIASSQAKIESALSQMEGNRERMKQLEEEAERLSGENAKAIAERDEISKQLEEHQKRVPDLEAARERSEREFQACRGSLDAARKTASELHRELSSKGSRLEVLRQLIASGEGLQKGTQAVLNGLNEPDLIKPGVNGVLGSHLKVPDEHAIAVEAALGHHLQAVIVRDDVLANEIIDRLTEGKKGEAALLPKSFLPASAGSQVEALPEGASAWALDVVSVDGTLMGLMEHLLSKVLIVPNRETAGSLRKSYPDLTFVTTAGEILSAEGLLRGGNSGGQKDSILVRQNEILSLEVETQELEASEKEAKTKIDDLEARVKELREEVEASKDNLQRHKVEESTLNGQLSLAKREAESFANKVGNNQWEREELTGREKTAADSRSAMENELARARERLTAAEDDARNLQKQVEEIQDHESSAQEQLNEARTALAVEKQARDSAAREQQPMNSRIKELTELNHRRESEIKASRDRIVRGDEENEALSTEMTGYKEELEKVTSELTHADGSRANLKALINEAEEQLTAIRQKQSRVGTQIGKEEVSATKLDLRLENLENSALERHQIELKAFSPDYHVLTSCIEERKQLEKKGRGPTQFNVQASVDVEEVLDDEVEVDAEQGKKSESSEEPINLVLPEEGPDWEFVSAIVADLKRRLDSMGPVNLDAIEEFDELEERYAFTKNQHDDLVNSKEKLLEIIDRINTESERLFIETFNAVALNFKSMFKKLFGEKATADLILQDVDNPLECGIEVIAKPPGKQLQSITLMSGGERSMTAVALLFSIYMVKPSPFCVLDELDAPLDESNIGRFLKVLDSFIDQSQFIIVTHSKRTMERADVMYGVTMEEFGVSKPVGMRLTSEADSLKGKDQTKSAAQKAALKLDA
ncbi:chromosome segregation protein SMC [Akkermansiaceae bacterium]|nr:chromosome segregation protein SMC [Akkermansiaceae bacterium]MDB4779140.1 chromosome segregation protein SMC [bacterium]